MKYSKHKTYYNIHGKEIPSATTLLKIINKPALSKWANALGFKRLKVDQVLDDYSIFGSTVHELISCFLQQNMLIFINDGNVNMTDLKESLSAFRDWYDNNNIETIFSEKQFTSEMFGGTIDFYGKVNNKYSLIDFKTSKKIRMSMFIQLALYTILLEENGYIVEQTGIVLCNGKHKDIKIINRDEMTDYIDLAKELVIFYHKYYNLNEKYNWGETI